MGRTGISLSTFFVQAHDQYCGRGFLAFLKATLMGFMPILLSKTTKIVFEHDQNSSNSDILVELFRKKVDGFEPAATWYLSKAKSQVLYLAKLPAQINALAGTFIYDSIISNMEVHTLRTRVEAFLQQQNRLNFKIPLPRQGFMIGQATPPGHFVNKALFVFLFGNKAYRTLYNLKERRSNHVRTEIRIFIKVSIFFSIFIYFFRLSNIYNHYSQEVKESKGLNMKDNHQFIMKIDMYFEDLHAKLKQKSDLKDYFLMVYKREPNSKDVITSINTDLDLLLDWNIKTEYRIQGNDTLICYMCRKIGEEHPEDMTYPVLLTIINRKSVIKGTIPTLWWSKWMIS